MVEKINFRRVGAYGLIGTFITHSLFGRAWHRKSHRREFHLNMASQYSRAFLDHFQFSITLEDRNDLLSKKENFLIVGNHQSYLDALIIASLTPSIFVTSVEMKNSPFVGFMAELGCSLFVERRNKEKIEEEIGLLAQRLEEGRNVVLFPEGTSTNGHEIKPFKVSFFSSAIKANKRVLPIAIAYEEINGEEFSLSNCDKVCWYGKMDFFPHLEGLMQLQSVKVRVKLGEPIDPQNHVDRISLALTAQDEVHHLYFSQAAHSGIVKYRR